jgi:hypothetical protein
MDYKTSEFKITLKNFEVEQLFNHFDVLGLEEIELDNGNFVYPENDEIKNVTLAIEKAI